MSMFAHKFSALFRDDLRNLSRDGSFLYHGSRPFSDRTIDPLGHTILVMRVRLDSLSTYACKAHTGSPEDL